MQNFLPFFFAEEMNPYDILDTSHMLFHQRHHSKNLTKLKNHETAFLQIHGGCQKNHDTKLVTLLIAVFKEQKIDIEELKRR